jgi:hypothetical protein
MPKDAEERVAAGVLKIAAAHPKGLATFNRCRSDIPSLVRLTAGDLAPSSTRPGEPMWHQIVRNIKSHDSEDSNYIARGYLEHVPRVGYRITPAGQRHHDRKA